MVSATERQFGIHICTESPYLAETRAWDPTKYHYIVTFENGYGASIIKGQHTYGGPRGLWELAVTHGPPHVLCYNTPITSDVLGYLTEPELIDYLDQIAQLPPNNSCTHGSIGFPTTEESDDAN